MKFKQGDTFDFSGAVTITDADGNAVDFSTWTAESAIFFPDEDKKVTLTATVATDSVRLFSDETEDWPTGKADIDVQFTSPSDEVVSTDTFRFEVIEGVT